MNNILKSFLMIVAIGAVAGGATWAAYNSTATVIGSTFSTNGTMNLKIDSDPNPQATNWTDSFTVDQQYFVKNLYPGFPSKGEVNSQILDLQNQGDFNGKLSIKLSRTSAWNELVPQLKFKIYYDALNNGSFVDTGYTGSLDDFTGTYDLGSINAGNIASVKIEWSVPVSAGNEIQGKTVTLNAVFGLEQTN